MIEAVIFDLDDTLVDHEALIPAAVAYAFAQLPGALVGISLEAFSAANRQAARELFAWPGLALYQAGPRIWARTLELVGLPPRPETVFQLYQLFNRYLLEQSRPRPGAIELLVSLKQQGYKLGVLSNGLYVERMEKLSRSGIARYLDAMVSSDMAGCDKPAAAPFQMILAALQIRPEQAIVVGDSLVADIEGAQRLGILAVQIVPAAPAASQQLEQHQHLCISQLGELPKILGSLAETGTPAGPSLEP